MVKILRALQPPVRSTEFLVRCRGSCMQSKLGFSRAALRDRLGPARGPEAGMHASLRQSRLLLPKCHRCVHVLEAKLHAAGRPRRPELGLPQGTWDSGLERMDRLPTPTQPEVCLSCLGGSWTKALFADTANLLRALVVASKMHGEPAHRNPRPAPPQLQTIPLRDPSRRTSQTLKTHDLKGKRARTPCAKTRTWAGRRPTAKGRAWRISRAARSSWHGHHRPHKGLVRGVV